MVEHRFCSPRAGVRFSLGAPFYPSVAQSGSASGLGPEGREFESLHSDQLWRVCQVDTEGLISLTERGALPRPATNFGDIVQLVEHHLHTVTVGSSSLPITTKYGPLVK